jgi:hypothetical protein
MNNYNLIELVNNEKTDKNTIHSYLSLYNLLLKNKKNSCQNVIEVGIKEGGSIKLWHDYFSNATIYGCDNDNHSFIWDEIKNNNRIKLFNSTNVYDPLFINNFKDIKFDFALNGTNTLESMIQFIELYLPLMKDDGILIVENIQEIKWLDILKSIIPIEFKNNIKTYDLRVNKNRYDDIVFVIDKKNHNPPQINTNIKKNNEQKSMNIDLDCCLVINTCKQYSSNINELIKQIQLYNVFPKENILIVSGQEDENSINYINGIKYVKVTYSGIHLTSAIYIKENLKDYLNINYWILLPDTIKFGPKFHDLIISYYKTMKYNQYTLPFINPIIRPTMDMGIVQTKHIINIADYLKKIKLDHIDRDNLLKLKKQLIYDENTILGLRAVCYEPSTKFNYLTQNTSPIYFITNSNSEIEISIKNNIQCIYFKNLDLYKYQQNFNGPETELIIAI